MATQSFEGDFRLRSIKLYPVTNNTVGKAIDLKDLVGEITLKESVLSASLYCNIVLKDIEENLISKLPLMGQERIELVISAGQKEIRKAQKEYRTNVNEYRDDTWEKIASGGYKYQKKGNPFITQSV